MKRFTKKIVLFFIPLLLLLGMTEYALRAIPNDYRYKKEYLDEHSEEIQTLILGSSHTFYGLKPEYFPNNTFNSSHVSQSLDYDFAILKKYSFSHLQTVIIPISYFTFFEQLGTAMDSWREKNYVLYYDITISDRFSNRWEVLSNDLFVNVRRLYLYYVKKQSNQTTDRLGWGTIYYSDNQRDLQKTGKINALLNTKDLSSESICRLYDENSMILRSVIEYCQDRNIHVVLFTPPAYETCRNNLSELQIRKAVDTAAEISGEYFNCSYLNLLDDKRFQKEDFYDADHLNEIGAENLSKMMVEELKF
jgi:hypothetical protein